MKHLFCWSLVLFVLVVSLAPAGDAKGGNDDAKKVVGTWKPVTAEMAGKALPEDFAKSTTLVITDGKYAVTVGEEKDEGTWKHDPTKKPRTLDITSTQGAKAGKKILAIYELKGDTLRVCYDLSGKERPKEFTSTPENKHFLVTYKRQKP